MFNDVHGGGGEPVFLRRSTCYLLKVGTSHLLKRKSQDMTRSSLTDESLILAARDGDLEAFAALVTRHHASVRAYLAVRVASLHDAEDLAQEALVIAFRKLSEFDAHRPLGPWLRGIAAKLLANQRRKFRAEPIGMNEDLQALLDSQLSGGVFAEREPEVFCALRDCLEGLDGPARELVHRRYSEGATIEELSRMLQRKASAVSMQLHRLRLALAGCIESRMAQAES